MIKALIIEDEKPLADYLREIVLEMDHGIEIVGIFHDVTPAIKAIEEFHPQLIFLDIMLPEGSGFNVLDAVPQRGAEVIFVTAHNSYWQQAFDYAAIGYILKPIIKSSLRTAIANASRRIEAGTISQFATILDKVLPKHREQTEKLAIPTSTGYRFENLENIIRLESENVYTWIYLSSGDKKLCSYSLGEFKKILPEKEFIQVHKSHIIATRHIVQFNVGDSLLEMSDGSHIPISRRNKTLFMSHFSTPKR